MQADAFTAAVGAAGRGHPTRIYYKALFFRGGPERSKDIVHLLKTSG
jgi:hypothetical protein